MVYRCLHKEHLMVTEICVCILRWRLEKVKISLTLLYLLFNYMARGCNPDQDMDVG